MSEVKAVVPDLTYAEKLRDPRWQKKRLEVMQKVEFRCAKCGIADRELQIHHTFYKDGVEPWDYPTESLQCLCNQCHMAMEGIKPLVPLNEALHRTLEQLDRAGGESYSGISTGFTELDSLTCGLQSGDMIVIASRPSVGKTAFALNIAEYVGVDLGRTCAYFSLEMSESQITNRLLCSRSAVEGQRLRRKMLSVNDYNALAAAVGELMSGRVFIDDTCGLTLRALRMKAQRLKAEEGLALIIVDYLQLMEGARGETRQQEITTISRGIKALARELNVPIICLSQLNRSNEYEQRLPRTSDLRESGSIEQDADVVLLLHREAVMYRSDQEWMDANPDKINEAILIVAKQRNGPCDNVKLTFLSGSTRFTNYSPGV